MTGILELDKNLKITMQTSHFTADQRVYDLPNCLAWLLAEAGLESMPPLQLPSVFL